MGNVGVSAPKQPRMPKMTKTPFSAIIAVFYRAIRQTERLHARLIFEKAKGKPTASLSVES
jgi:hypothetical protein